MSTPEQPTQRRLHPLVWAMLLAAALSLLTGALATAVHLGWVDNPLQRTAPEPVATSAPVCDPGMVIVRPTTINGVSLEVDGQGSRMVQIDVWSSGSHRRLYQQTPGGAGAQFALWGDHMYSYSRIDVRLMFDGSTCTVSDSVIDELNRAHGWRR